MNRILLQIICVVTAMLSAELAFAQKKKSTICILGGTPSTKEILNLIPDSIKSDFNFISFNRPGFGGSKNEKLSEDMLYKLAKDAGLKPHDFGIIGISGGAPLAILIAAKFKLKHCGIISGMVSKDAFFKHGDKAVTKDIMQTALGAYSEFETSVLRFPNVDEIVRQAGATSKDVAIRACYDEFNFILSDGLFPVTKKNSLAMDWWHGENDVNVPIQSVELFLRNYPNATLNKISSATHAMDANVYLSKILNGWRKK